MALRPNGHRSRSSVPPASKVCKPICLLRAGQRFAFRVLVLTRLCVQTAGSLNGHGTGSRASCSSAGMENWCTCSCRRWTCTSRWCELRNDLQGGVALACDSLSTTHIHIYTLTNCTFPCRHASWSGCRSATFSAKWCSPGGRHREMAQPAWSCWHRAFTWRCATTLHPAPHREFRFISYPEGTRRLCIAPQMPPSNFQCSKLDTTAAHSVITTNPCAQTQHPGAVRWRCGRHGAFVCVVRTQSPAAC